MATPQTPIPSAANPGFFARMREAARRLWLLDRCPEEVALKGAAFRARQRRITWLRRSVQIFFGALILWIGVDFVRWVRGLEAGQIVGERPPGVEGFLPISGLMSFRHLYERGEISPVHPAALILLALFVGMGMLAKKGFCSWVCPVGSLSEALAALSRRLFGRRIDLPRWLDLPLRSLKYLLLAFFAWAIFVKMSPAALQEFLDSPYNKVADIKMLYFFEHLSPFAAKALVVLVLASLVVPYAWCRYLCPYGALLGLTSLLSPFKITRDATTCIDCSLCAKACPARLPVDKLKRVRSDECVGCLSCVADCPVPRALRVEGPRRFGGRPLRPALLAALLVGLFVGGVLLARATGHWQTNVPDAEYLQRIQHDLDAPQYQHIR